MMTAPSKSLMASASAARLSMSRWLVGSSRMIMLGAWKVASPSSSRAFSPPERLFTSVSAASPEKPIAPARRRGPAAGETLHQRIGRLAGKADRAGARADFRFRGIAHQPADVIVGRAIKVELVDLMRGGGDRK